MVNTHIARFASGLAIAGTLASGAWLGMAAGHAQGTITSTVDGVDYPICAMEDCSDQIGQTGVWIDPDTGDRYLELGESVTFLIDPLTAPFYPTAHGVAAADDAAPGPR